jgi:hypothetical protein
MVKSRTLCPHTASRPSRQNKLERRPQHGDTGTAHAFKHMAHFATCVFTVNSWSHSSHWVAHQPPQKSTKLNSSGTHATSCRSILQLCLPKARQDRYTCPLPWPLQRVAYQVPRPLHLPTALTITKGGLSGPPKPADGARNDTTNRSILQFGLPQAGQDSNSQNLQVRGPLHLPTALPISGWIIGSPRLTQTP